MPRPASGAEQLSTPSFPHGWRAAGFLLWEDLASLVSETL